MDIVRLVLNGRGNFMRIFVSLTIFRTFKDFKEIFGWRGRVF